MKLNFSNKVMEIGTFPFNFVRTLMVAGSGGAELSECLLVASQIKDNQIESWVQAWSNLAQNVAGQAQHAEDHGELITARQAWMRASNYYRSAMFSLPINDHRLGEYLILSQKNFKKAAYLFTPAIEFIEVPFGQASLPGYFLSAGQPHRPTLLALNGGDSTNEELVHWLGFAAQARGWNFFTFEGPGQWSMLFKYPDQLMRPDYEVPVKAVLDMLCQREDVDAGQIALFGPSLGAGLAARVAACEPRLKACIADGLVVDVYEAWHAVWPKLLQNASPATFDRIFTLFEKLSPQLHGMSNHFRWMLGKERPHEVIEAWQPFNVMSFANQMHCPLLMIYGEAELAQTDEIVPMSILRFVKAVKAPLTMRTFTFNDGWAATHCQIGACVSMQDLVFDWLERTVIQKEMLPARDLGNTVELMKRYFKKPAAIKELEAFA